MERMVLPDLPPAKRRKTETTSVPVISELDDQDGNDYHGTGEDFDTEHDPGTNDNEISDGELEAEGDQAVKDDGTTVDDEEDDQGTEPDETIGSDESTGTEEDTGSDEGSVELPPKRYGPNVVQTPPVQEVLKNLRDHLEKLCTTISRSDLANQPATFLHRVHEQALAQSEFKIPETRTLGFVGDPGAGKSSMINSLLEQIIAQSSRSGSACTCVVTEFRYAGDDPEFPYRIEIFFMATTEVHELLEELLRSFREFYCNENWEEIGDSNEEKQRLKNTADTAWETLRSMFKSLHRLSHKFLSRKGRKKELDTLSKLQSWVLAEMNELPGINDLHHTMTAESLQGCKDHLDRVTSSVANNDGPVLWPFIKLIQVYLKAPILQKGLVLVDMPGLRDLNHARVRATEQYLLHEYDEVFIVTGMARCSSDQSIVDLKTRYSSKGRPGIVVTRSDDVDANESATDKSISLANREIILRMNTEIEETEKAIKEMKVRLRTATQTASQDEITEVVLRSAELDGQKEDQEFQRLKFLIDERNKRNTRKLLKKHSGMQVFCISNQLYFDNQYSLQDQGEAYRSLSGIPELREYCQSVPAEAQAHFVDNFLGSGVPALIGSGRQWCLAGLDKISSEQGTVVCQVLKEVENSLREEFLQSRALAIGLQKELDREYNNLVLRSISQLPIRFQFASGLGSNIIPGTLNEEWSSAAVELHGEWKLAFASTYSACCRRNGNHITRSGVRYSWNSDIGEQPRDYLNPKWDRLLDWLKAQESALYQRIIATFAKSQRSTENIKTHAPRALGNLLASLRPRRKDIIFSARKLIRNLVHRLVLEKDDMLEAHDSSWIAQYMRPAYLACCRESGEESHSRRTSHMTNHLSRHSPFAHYHQRAQSTYHTTVRPAFTTFQLAVVGQIESMVNDIKLVTSQEKQVPETELAPGLAQELLLELKAVDEARENARAIFDKARVEEAQIAPENS